MVVFGKTAGGASRYHFAKLGQHFPIGKTLFDERQKIAAFLARGRP